MGEAGAPHTDFDLCAWLSAWACPANLTVRKVKAHQTLDLVSAADLRPALGNMVADTAAKAARDMDLPLVRELLQSVEEWATVQEDMLISFFAFQSELTRLLASVKPDEPLQDFGCQC